MYSRDSEIRHLSSADIYKLGQILDQTNSWKKLMRIIPKDITSKNDQSAETSAKYTNDHIKLVENASIKQNRMSTEILFDEWGTSGKQRPTIGFLLELLVDAELFRAADFVAEKFLNEPHPSRPNKGPAAKVDISLPLATEEIKAIEEILNDASCPGTQTLNENAQVTSNLINKDFYEKYGKDDKKLDIEYSDFMKFSLNSVELKSSENIPIELIETKNSIIKHEQSPITSNIDSNANEDISSSNKIDTIENSINDLPILSALNNDEDNFDVQLPDLSALNISDGVIGDNRSNSRSGSFGNSSSLSTHTDDEGDNLTPNLSILDQKSNDDSSLTNVTDTTSENISFETDANNENSLTTTGTTDSNIPCLSDLQK